MELSEVGIASAALIHLGKDPIADLDAQNDPNARILKERLPGVRDALLRSYPWNFAKYFASLPASALAAPMFGFTHRCALPAGGELPFCLRIWKVDTTAEYSVQGRYLYLKGSGPVTVAYVGRNENYEEYDPLFAELLALDLALAVINKIPSRELARTKRELKRDRRKARRDAGLTDAMEASAQALSRGGDNAGTWLGARRDL